MRNVVVLPHPDGPRKLTNSPGSTSRLKDSTATTPLNSLRTPCRLRNPLIRASAILEMSAIIPMAAQVMANATIAIADGS